VTTGLEVFREDGTGDVLLTMPAAASGEATRGETIGSIPPLDMHDVPISRWFPVKNTLGADLTGDRRPGPGDRSHRARPGTLFGQAGRVSLL
jgi:hypothetical protein